MIEDLVSSVQNLFGTRRVRKKPRIIPKEEHGIDIRQVSPFAINICERLQNAGFVAYIVGGAVRDLLIGHRPKDFDVATDATPEQVKKVTRRAIIIGRRFRLVHVIKGSETIEVSTFRALGDAGVSKSDKGRVLVDNVFGEQWEDAARRDFTVNAMYYDPSTEEVLDYHNGMLDVRKKRIRMIGDPEVRYREDPVRILRAIRISSKLGFTIDPKTSEPMGRMSVLLKDIPQARLSDELLKILASGAALACLQNLLKYQVKLPNRVLHPWVNDPENLFLNKALARCDARVEMGKSISSSFIFAALLWPEMQGRYPDAKLSFRNASREWNEACREMLDKYYGEFQNRLYPDIFEIWQLQLKFERISPGRALGLLDHPRFRAAYDFLLIRASCGEVPHAIADWWTAFEAATIDEQSLMLSEVPSLLRGLNKSVPEAESTSKKKRRKKKGATPKENKNLSEEKTISQEILPAEEAPSVKQPMVETVRSTILTPSRPRVTGLRKRYPGALLSSKKPGDQR